MRPIYLGVDGKATQNTDIYAGIDDVAKKVVRMYIGDENNKAQLCYDAEMLVSLLSDDISAYSFSDDITKRNMRTYIEFANRLLLTGGTSQTDSSKTNQITAINSDLTVTDPIATFGNVRHSHSACVVNNKYVAFMGGITLDEYDRDIYSTDIEIFDRSMTKVKTTSISGQYVNKCSGASVGEYGIFFGGVRKYDNASALEEMSPYIISINDSLTVEFHEVLSTNKRSNPGVAYDKDYAIFFGGIISPSTVIESDYVDAVDKSLTYTTIGTGTSCSTAKGVSVGDYYLFGSYTFSDGSNSASIRVYDKSLTSRNTLSLEKSKQSMTVYGTGDEAIFAGGYTSSSSSDISYKDIEIFNKELTKSLASLTANRRNGAGARFKDKILLYFDPEAEIIKLK